MASSRGTATTACGLAMATINAASAASASSAGRCRLRPGVASTTLTSRSRLRKGRVLDPPALNEPVGDQAERDQQQPPQHERGREAHRRLRSRARKAAKVRSQSPEVDRTMLDAERCELACDLRPVVRCSLREAFGGAGGGRCRREPSAPSRDRRARRGRRSAVPLARVPDLDRHDGVPRREPEQWSAPVARAPEVRDDHGQRALPRDPGELGDGGPDRGPPHALGLGLAPDGEHDREQPHAPLTRTQCNESFAPKVATPMRLPRREARWPSATATPSATSHLRRSAVPKRIDGETSRRTTTSAPARRRRPSPARFATAPWRSSRSGGRRRPAPTREAARARFRSRARPSDARRRAAVEPPADLQVERP